MNPTDLADLATIFGFPLLLLGTYVAIRSWADPIIKAKRVAKEFGAAAFDEQQVQRAIRGYVEPDCSQLDPSGEEDSRRMFSVRSPLIPEMDKLLSEDHEGKHVLLLADSGMGKTSFLLHYYARNKERGRADQQRIAIVPLGRPNAETAIRQIESKRNTVIFLDAFDEDVHAIHDHRARLETLMSLCADFNRVVVSCRTQFFPTEEEVPRETGVARVGPRPGGQRRIYTFYKLYLAPFSDSQVRRYIRKRFGLLKFHLRRRAFQIVRSIPELSVRPMLLALVPDLVLQKRFVHELYELYEFMVESWLVREEQWIKKDALRRISEQLAVDLYVNREARGMERIPREELAGLVQMQVTEIEQWQLTSRSLLNRDPEGNYKFAHRSIMEYLFVCALAKGDRSCLDVEWTDLMKQLFISWGSHEVRRGRVQQVNDVLRSDFRKTGLFPIFQQPRGPEQLPKAKILRANYKADRLALYARLAHIPRTAYTQFFKIDDALFVTDFATDTVFWFPVDLLDDNARDLWPLFFLSRAAAQRQQDDLNRNLMCGRSDWRAPTLEEFDSLLLHDDVGNLLEEQTFYWLADRAQAEAWIVATLRKNLEKHPHLHVIGVRELSAGEGKERSYTVLASQSVGDEGFSVESSQYKAYQIHVSRGRAEDFAEAIRAHGGVNCRCGAQD